MGSVTGHMARGGKRKSMAMGKQDQIEIDEARSRQAMVEDE